VATGKCQYVTCRNLTRKDLLKYHLERQSSIFSNSRFANYFKCMPTSFSLPREFSAFEAAFLHATSGKVAPCPHQSKSSQLVSLSQQLCSSTSWIECIRRLSDTRLTGDCRAVLHSTLNSLQVWPSQRAGLNLWIVKPSSSSRGRGIYLLDDLSAALCSQPCVVQRYIADPMLHQGHKFDLRLYVLVTSFNPLEAFIYKVRSKAHSKHANQEPEMHWNLHQLLVQMYHQGLRQEIALYVGRICKICSRALHK
jgi:hypothetical protein